MTETGLSENAYKQWIFHGKSSEENTEAEGLNKEGRAFADLRRLFPKYPPIPRIVMDW